MEKESIHSFIFPVYRALIIHSLLTIVHIFHCPYPFEKGKDENIYGGYENTLEIILLSVRKINKN